MRISTKSLAAVGVAVLLGAGAAATPAQAAFSPVPLDLRALTLSATSQNVTTAVAPITVTVTFGPNPAGFTKPSVNAYFTQAPSSGDLAGSADWAGAVADLTLTAGSASTTSTWRGTFTPRPGAAGTYRFTVENPYFVPNGGQSLTADEVDAAVGPRVVTTSVTAPPAAPTNLKGSTRTTWSSSELGFVTSRTVTWKNPAGKALPSGVKVVSASANCGYMAAGYNPGAPVSSYWVGSKIGLCTVKFQTVNSAGASPTVSLTFL
ncbi:hypothetical protein ACIB24_14190 [Spongisporangium articulatum]|uniref:Uncharacterized protein n=1 Tax=Spongisporangium articulatum TaxID=3362603 RepID=A0ABW8APB7_9ACTN